MLGETGTMRYGVTRKRSTRLEHTGNLFRIPEPNCVRKETVDINILVTSRNCDRKIMQSIRITSRPPSRKRKWNQLSQF